MMRVVCVCVCVVRVFGVVCVRACGVLRVWRSVYAFGEVCARECVWYGVVRVSRDVCAYMA